jgi:hypothetical protein
VQIGMWLQMFQRASVILGVKYSMRITNVLLTFLAHSVHMRSNFQGLPLFKWHELREDELIIRFLLN